MAPPDVQDSLSSLSNNRSKLLCFYPNSTADLSYHVGVTTVEELAQSALNPLIKHTGARDQTTAACVAGMCSTKELAIKMIM